MSSLYLSTGRKPSQLTRKVSRLLSLILQGKYENRGKKSVSEICSRAEKFGCQKVAFIYEKKGNPASIEFFDEEGGWLEEIISVSGIYFHEKEGRKRIPSKIKLTAIDDTGVRMIALLGLENEVEDETSLLEGNFSKTGIAFYLGGVKVLELKGSLGRIANENGAD